jgi:hypothetical protein
MSLLYQSSPSFLSANSSILRVHFLQRLWIRRHPNIPHESTHSIGPT